MGLCARPGDSMALVRLHLDNSHLFWHAGDAQSIGCLTRPLSVEPGLALTSWFSTPVFFLSPQGQAGTQRGSTMSDQLNSLSE